MNQNQKKDPKAIIGGCAIMIVLAGILFFSLKSCLSSSPEEEKADKERNMKIKALTYSQNCVNEKLKSPSSSEYPVNTEFVTKSNDSTYIVNSYVDSQNGFGAMIRSKFVCIIIMPDEDHYRCKEVAILQ